MPFQPPAAKVARIKTERSIPGDKSKTNRPKSWKFIKLNLFFTIQYYVIFSLSPLKRLLTKTIAKPIAINEKVNVDRKHMPTISVLNPEAILTAILEL